MTNPASELIALADNELLAYCRDDASRWASAFVAIKEAQGWGSNDIDNDLMICWFANAIEGATAYRTAANQSGSERAGVDALREALDCLQSISDMEDNEPRQPDDADWRFRALECKRAAQCTIAALATPPAQPAPVWPKEEVSPGQFADVDPEVLEATHGKPDGAVRAKSVDADTPYPSPEAMKAAVELEIHRALGSVQTVVIGKLIQQAIDAALSPKIAAVETSPGDAASAPDLSDLHQRALTAAAAFEDAASYEETMWTGWGECVVPPHAEMRRIKAQQAVCALRDAQKRESDR